MAKPPLRKKKQPTPYHDKCAVKGCCRVPMKRGVPPSDYRSHSVPGGLFTLNEALANTKACREKCSAKVCTFEGSLIPSARALTASLALESKGRRTFVKFCSSTGTHRVSVSKRLIAGRSGAVSVSTLHYILTREHTNLEKESRRNLPRKHSFPRSPNSQDSPNDCRRALYEGHW